MHPNHGAMTLVDWPSILRTHGQAVWRTIYRMVGDADSARDCYQETFLAALQKARTHPVENWSAFLQTLATRRAIDCLRERYLNKARLHLADDLDDVAVEAVTPGLAQVEKADLCQRVRLLLSGLPPRQAQAFWMRYMEQMSVSQIAEQMETAPGNVSVLLNRACAHLRAALAESGHDNNRSEVRA
jgi:RNA polymerase sigma-70 factor (ECF subfamily)